MPPIVVQIKGHPVFVWTWYQTPSQLKRQMA